MVSDEIKTFNLEKHQTRDIKDGHINGSLIPVWKDYQDIIKVRPEMVYVTTVNPGEIKGPHLHIIRHSYFVCIKGKVMFVVQDKMGKYHEIESSYENPVLIEVPKTYASGHINISNEVSIILSLVNPAWRPDNRDEHDVTFEDYDWSKWKKSLKNDQ